MICPASGTHATFRNRYFGEYSSRIWWRGLRHHLGAVAAGVSRRLLYFFFLPRTIPFFPVRGFSPRAFPSATRCSPCLGVGVLSYRIPPLFDRLCLWHGFS